MKKVSFFISFFIITVPLLATVGLEVGNDVLVETSDGVYVEIDSNLTETGTGYFKGTITSGARTGMTTFAGMTLGTGIDGSITRYTGSAYSKGNGEGTNFKRYYEINNTSGDTVESTVQMIYVGSGSNDERNGLSSPYYAYRYISDWIGHGDGAAASPVSACDLQIIPGLSDWLLSDGDFVTYSESVAATVGSPIYFNDPGDGRQVDMTFSSVGGSGNVTVNQINHCPQNVPCRYGCGYQWAITKDVTITSFNTDIVFHYNDSDVEDHDESEAYFGMGKFNTSTNTWVWLGGTVNGGANTVTLTGVTTFSTFGLFRRIFGDCTGDGYVDAADLQRLGDCWHDTNTGEFTPGCDARFFNYNKNTDAGNQIIDAGDLQVFGDCWHNGVEP